MFQVHSKAVSADSPTCSWFRAAFDADMPSVAPIVVRGKPPTTTIGHGVDKNAPKL
jgi:hypothetical protein